MKSKLVYNLQDKKKYESNRATELIRLLYLSVSYVDPNPGRDHINGLDHALRVATLARRHDPMDVEMQFVALVHDLARPLSDIYHGEVMAEIVRDMVWHNRYKVLQRHGDYQANVMYGHELDRSVPWDSDASKLCAWEFASFSKSWSYPMISMKDAKNLIKSMCGTRK